MSTLIDFFLHLDQHLGELSASLGGWMYVVLALIIFCETGLVIMPFLPGDSLLFAVGALCALPSSGLNLGLMMVLLCVAAIIGDAVNYSIGRYIGPQVFSSDSSKFLNRKHLEYTARFYEKHGGKTIILARFIPIVRTFAPFVAGVGKMDYRRFALFNIVGGVAWVVGFLGLGYALGNTSFVQERFHYVIVGIIVVSIAPAVIEYLRARWKGNEASE